MLWYHQEHVVRDEPDGEMNSVPASLPHWGILPILFHLGRVEVPAYGFFMLLAVAAGVICFALEARRQRESFERGLALVLAAYAGGILGAKLPIWFMHGREILASPTDFRLMLSGRTIVGGVLGGILAVVITRRVVKMPMPSGNLFAPGLALAIAIGRLGCFCAGCCYGIPTHLSWGVDFGDGLLRYPTQLIEAAFAAGLFVYLQRARSRLSAPGQLFTRFILAYFIFRFGIEFLRAEPRPYLGLTLAQVVSAGIVLYYTGRGWKRPVLVVEGEQHG